MSLALPQVPPGSGEPSLALGTYGRLADASHLVLRGRGGGGLGSRVPCRPSLLSLSRGRWPRAWGLAVRAPVTPPPLQTSLQRLMSSAEEPCRHLAFGLALRSIQNNPR